MFKVLCLRDGRIGRIALNRSDAAGWTADKPAEPGS